MLDPYLSCPLGASGGISIRPQEAINRERQLGVLTRLRGKSRISIIALTPKLRCPEGYGCLFLTPKKPMLLCSHIPPEAGKAADEGGLPWSDDTGI
jgi:hypothetical protein